MSQTLFITGTDTGVGKTWISCALLRQARAAGLRAAGYKPVASGCRETAAGLRNDDAEALVEAAGTSETYEAINPYAFAPPIAPHLAAAQVGVRIECQRLDDAHAALAAHHDFVLVEGAGGWQVPLNDAETYADWVGRRGWPVLLVVAVRLGCLNHALLSVESIVARTRLLGWVANQVPADDPVALANVDTLRARIAAPLLGVVRQGDAGAAGLWGSLVAQGFAPDDRRPGA